MADGKHRWGGLALTVLVACMVMWTSPALAGERKSDAASRPTLALHSIAIEQLPGTTVAAGAGNRPGSPAGAQATPLQGRPERAGVAGVAFPGAPNQGVSRPGGQGSAVGMAALPVTPTGAAVFDLPQRTARERSAQVWRNGSTAQGFRPGPTGSAGPASSRATVTAGNPSQTGKGANLSTAPSVLSPTDAGDPARTELIAWINHYSKAYGVDPRLTYAVVEQESRFNIRAKSHKGAQGLMQIMPGTQKRLGLEDPYDARQNLEAGIRYLAMLLEGFKTKDLALAAYNAGEEAVNRHGGIPPYKETQHYVRVILGRYEQLVSDQNQSAGLATPDLLPSLATAAPKKIGEKGRERLLMLAQGYAKTPDQGPEVRNSAVRLPLP